jgi:hypothetical protein
MSTVVNHCEKFQRMASVWKVTLNFSCVCDLDGCWCDLAFLTARSSDLLILGGSTHITVTGDLAPELLCCATHSTFHTFQGLVLKRHRKYFSHLVEC